ncbi:hypothetical protein ABPG72_010652 [Tetrahymena utriculariae]
MEMEVEFDCCVDGDTRNRRFKCLNFKKRDNQKEKQEREQKKLQREEQRKAASVTIIKIEAEPAKPSKNIISSRMTKEEKNKIYEQDMIENKPKGKEHKMKCFLSSHKI